MRILHLGYGHVDNPWISGGAPQREHEINRRLARNHDVTVVCGMWPGASRERDVDGVRYLHVGSSRSYALSRLSYSFAAARACRRLDADIIVEDVSGFAPIFAGIRPRRPTVALVHHLASPYILRSHGLMGFACRAYESLVLHSHKHFIAVSESTSQAIKEGTRQDVEVAVVHNGVDFDLFDEPRGDSDYMLFLGKQEPYMKGLDVLFQAFALARSRHPSLQLRIAGYGEPGASQALARKVGLNGQVDIQTEISEQKKRKLLANCTALVMPSRYEGWGIVAIEAAACGKPVIGTRVPGLVDSVRHGETGLLVPSEDADALADAMCRIAQDDQLRHRLGNAGRNWARSFSWDEAARKQAQFYSNVLEAEAG